jgi:nucleotide-binding universal stress UspA family protein
MQTLAIAKRVSFENILYATDFSSHSAAALPYALSIARKYGSKVFAVHVISLSPFPNSAPTLALQAIAAQAVREAKAAIAHLEPRLKGVSHEAIIRKGELLEQLSAIIAEKRIDLIVAGTRGRTGVSKVLMGSIAEKIFRQAPCPVLTVGPNVSGEPGAIVDSHSILLSIDFSPESLAAAPYAISLALENQARLYLLHVTENLVDREAEESLKTRLLGLIPQDTELLCEPKAYISSGQAPQKILELADELAVDLMVLGVKRTPRFPGAATHLAMATAYKVVTEAICPVLTVRG